MLVKNCSAHGRQQMALAARPGRAQQPEEHVRRRIIGLPFLGELWGEVGGDESWDEALDTVSSGCLRCRSLLSSDRDRIFFRDWGELVPADIHATRAAKLVGRSTAITSSCTVWGLTVL